MPFKRTTEKDSRLYDCKTTREDPASVAVVQHRAWRLPSEGRHCAISSFEFVILSSMHFFVVSNQTGERDAGSMATVKSQFERSERGDVSRDRNCHSRMRGAQRKVMLYLLAV